jgi:CDP-diacylglycerol--serine O-phosphatidyltransferase
MNRSLIPNLFTLLNLFLGCMAIVFALQTENITINSNEEFVSSFNIPEKLSLAALCIFAAAAVDFLDGFLARLLGADSLMGKQLDSLCDVVSFGVAPGVILYQLLRMSYMREEFGLDVSSVFLWPAFIVSLASAWRLAKFNIDDTQRHSFAGVPTPAAGLLVASLPLILHYPARIPQINALLINKFFLYGLIAVLSLLMVSRIRLMAMKPENYSFAQNKFRYLLAGIAVAAALTLHWLAVPVVFVAYILLSLADKKS